MTGPAFPALDVCEEPSVGVMVGGVGYNGYLATVEIADSGASCGGVISNLPVGRKGANQGGRIFEISWEPNFPVNNFARNNGKIVPSST